MTETAEGDAAHQSAHDLRQLHQVQGRWPATSTSGWWSRSPDSFRREAPGHLMASEQVLAPEGVLGRGLDVVRRLAIGRRIATDREIEERIGPVKGLAIFASDNISSSAYATEEIMRVLVLAGAGALAPHHAADHRHRHRARGGGHQLSADHSGLPRRRWLVHRGHREPRASVPG